MLAAFCMLGTRAHQAMAALGWAQRRCPVPICCRHAPTYRAASSISYHSHKAICRRRQPGHAQLSVASNAAVGIDLGTTSSALALIGRDGQPYILHDQHGKAIVPSVVSIHESGEVLVGQAAVQASAAGSVDSAAHFFSIKRLMGRTPTEVAQLASRLPYDVVAHPNGWAGLRRPAGMATKAKGSNAGAPAHSSDDVMLPQEVGAYVLRHLLERVEAHLAESETSSNVCRTPDTVRANTAPQVGCTVVQPAGAYPPLQHVTEAVITVPAHFSAAARAATIEAGRLAGLQRVELLQEPIAAAMAYGFGVGGAAAHSYDTLLVFDLGGGTFDVSLLEGWDGILEVLVTEGDDELGGDDLTRALADLLLTKLPDGKSLQVLSSQQRLAVTLAAEELKRQLSTMTDDAFTTVQAQLPEQGAETEGMSNASSSAQVAVQAARAVQITQREVEAAWAPLLYRLWPPLLRLAASSRLQYSGCLPDAAQQHHTGQAHAPQQQQQGAVKDASAPEQWQHDMFPVHPASTQHVSGMQRKYVAPPRRLTGVVLVGAATRTPAVRHFVTQLCGMEPAAGADPEEVVALGAALQAGVLSGEVGYGAELTDGGYIASEHGRSSGWSSDSATDWVP